MFSIVRTQGTRRSQRSPGGKDGLIGMNLTSTPSRRSAAASAAAWTPWPPRMSRLAATNPTPGFTDSRFTGRGSTSRRDPRRRADGCGRVIHGVGPREPRGPAVEKDPAPELERDQGPQLQIQRPASPVQLEETLDVPLVEDAATPAGLREQQVADEA